MARQVARAIGWLFVAVIGYHAVLAAVRAVQAGSDGHWGHAAELAAIALVAGGIVAAALVNAVRSKGLR